MTFWLLIIQIFNPCCNITLTTFDTFEECEAARQVILTQDLLTRPGSARAIGIDCEKATIKIGAE